MLITLKNLQQQTFKFDFDESKTVLEFKEFIQEYVACPTDSQKLIYSGNFMEDHRTMESYKIVEDKFIVFMPSKPVTIPEPPKPTQATQPNPKAEEIIKTVSEPTTKTESILLTGNEYNEAVETIMSMCETTREMTEQALHASFNNPNRAVEYLINRQIPEVHFDQGQLHRTPVIPSSTEPLAFLRNEKEFHAMKKALHENPNLLQSIVQSIGEHNPALLKLITDNQAEFVAMLNEPITSGDLYGTMIITEEDRLVINRLKALGYSEDAVLEAYFACDKNEELAANFLCGN